MQDNKTDGEDNDKGLQEHTEEDNMNNKYGKRSGRYDRKNKRLLTSLHHEERFLMNFQGPDRNSSEWKL